MSEKRILLASLLKPVNDTRLYEKLGLSLSKLPGATVHICGFSAPLPADTPSNLVFHTAFHFKRLSLGRAKAQIQYYHLLVQVKPHLIIVSTHELLLVSLTYKRRYGGKLIYDIQENYALNLQAQHNYAWPLKQLMALAIRGTERLSASAIDHFFLAERSYAEELPFIGNRYTMLENKYKVTSGIAPAKTPVSIPENGPLRLLYSGTIAEEYGIWEAIRLTDQLHAINSEVRLTIIGYCANTSTLQRLQEECRNRSYLTLIGGDRLVPHTQILEQISQSHIGLLPYRPNASTFRCIPTKLYEYMAHALPILIQHNPLWQCIVEGNGAGIAIDFAAPDSFNLYQKFCQTAFYAQGIPEDIYWESEELRLLKVVQAVLK